MRGTIAKRLRREAEQQALLHNRKAVDRWGLRTVTGILTREKKRILKRMLRSHIDSPNRQTMMSRTEAVTRTKKIVWSFFSSSPLRVTGTKVSTHCGRNERVFNRG